MSLKRRLVAAGLPVAGATVFAAVLALAGQPASAAYPPPVDSPNGAAANSTRLQLPLNAPVSATCNGIAIAGIATGDCPADGGQGDGAGPDRGNPGYTGANPDTPAGGAGPDGILGPDGITGPDGIAGPGNNPGDGNGDGDGNNPGDGGSTRGNDGYGGAGPDEVPDGGPGPDEVPDGGAGPDEVPDGGAGPDEAPDGGVSPAEAPIDGAADADALPVTGSPIAALATIGVLLTVAGIALRVYAARRRRVS